MAKQFRMSFEKFVEEVERLKHTSDGEPYTCSSCGDTYSPVMGKRLTGDKCPECFVELEYGKLLDTESVHFCGGVPSSRADNSPWQQNAVKYLEDG